MPKLIVVASLALLATASLQAQQNGEDLAFQYKCATCHGPQGISMDSRYPHLAGQKEAYLASRLRSFRAKEHPYNFMNGQAGSLSDEDIEILAAYYSRMQPF